MSFILNTLVPFFLVYKYWALFLVCFLSSVALPLPAATSLTAMSAFAASGYVDFPLTILAAFAGYVFGDCFDFWLARIFGRRILKLPGFRQLAKYKYYLEAENYVEKHSAVAVFLSRFVTTAGAIVNLLAGLLSDLSFKKFLFYDILGEGLDTLLFAFVGYFFGDQFQTYGSYFTLIEIGLVIIAFLAYQAFARRRA